MSYLDPHSIENAKPQVPTRIKVSVPKATAEAPYGWAHVQCTTSMGLKLRKSFVSLSSFIESDHLTYM